MSHTRINDQIATYGARSLNNDELLQAIIEIKEDRAHDIIHQSGGLRQLVHYTPNELAASHQLTPRQSRILHSAVELAKRINQASQDPQPQITCPEDAINILAPLMADALQEELHVLSLNTRNRVIDHRVIYIGAVDNSPIRPAEVLRPAVMMNAKGLMMAHNHPSGDPAPSPEDIRATRDIFKAGALLDIELLDHIVIGHGHRFVSLKAKGLGFD